MKALLVTGAGALLMLAGAVSAQTAAPGDITTTHLAALDTDQNGAVSNEEMTAFAAEAFKVLDKNGDGYVTVVEFGALITPEQFAAVNTNGDGGISLQEFKAQVAADFAAADLDHDGALN
ncbi:EF-hand domain-containing protein [Amaricoccus sp.]|uniref:EF-hand domain-containing protein n=1 Tax=Amaricoccus sp. TaxID=1872485 RepID=UPI002629466B|nr:EF-hand domain-containing protein [uncultured Amaricoccus sp.]